MTTVLVALLSSSPAGGLLLAVILVHAAVAVLVLAGASAVVHGLRSQKAVSYRPAARIAALSPLTKAATRAGASSGGDSSITRASALPTMTASAKPATQAACSGL